MKTKKNDFNSWHKLYSKYIKQEFKNWDEYFKIKMKLKKKFLNLVLKYYDNKRPVLECGCGTGKFSAYLASLGLKTYAMDIEHGMVEQSKQLSEKISPKNPVKVLEGDIREIPYKNNYFSLTHSSGVLEHYEDEEIVKLINEQLRVSDYCIFSVPTPYFENKMLGNERFMYRKEWRKIISLSDAEIIEESGYHYKTLKNRLIDIIKNPKNIFKPIALYVFVLKRRNNK